MRRLSELFDELVSHFDHRLLNCRNYIYGDIKIACVDCNLTVGTNICYIPEAIRKNYLAIIADLQNIAFKGTNNHIKNIYNRHYETICRMDRQAEQLQIFT